MNKSWEYAAGSDSEYICAYLNRESVLDLNPIENITNSLRKIYDVYNQIGVVLIFDNNGNHQYVPTRDLLRGPGIGRLLNVHAQYGNNASSRKDSVLVQLNR